MPEQEIRLRHHELASLVAAQLASGIIASGHERASVDSAIEFYQRLYRKLAPGRGDFAATRSLSEASRRLLRRAPHSEPVEGRRALGRCEVGGDDGARHVGSTQQHRPPLSVRHEPIH